MKLSEELVPKPGPILMTSSPQGAEIWIGGEKWGKTSETLDLRPGSVEISFVLDGFGAEKRQIDVEAATPATLNVVLHPGETVRPFTRPLPWHWASAGGAALSFVGTITLGSLAISAREEAREMQASDVHREDVIGRGKRNAVLANLSFLVGAGLAILTYSIRPRQGVE